MFNQLSDPIRSHALQRMLEGKLPVMSPQFNRTGSYYEQYTGHVDSPGAIIFYPVFERASDNTSDIVGSIATEFAWRDYTKSSMYPPHSDLLSIVIENSCGQVFTYRLIDQDLELQGAGYLQDAAYNGSGQSSTYHDYEDVVRVALPSTTPSTAAHEAAYCRYRFSVYPTAVLQAEYKSDKPAIYALITAGIFVIVAVLFVIYDCIVRRRQRKVMLSARTNGAIVSSMFPKTVRERLYSEAKADAKQNKLSSSQTFAPPKLSKSCSLSNVPVNKPKKVDPIVESKQTCSSNPIAELFDNTTIMFLDLAGFTAWASYREPRQVFQLLETLYGAFDELALSLGVFKIETIGDCYVGEYSTMWV
jgi:Adenylate and Guanylate cyclase catalytic domain